MTSLLSLPQFFPHVFFAVNFTLANIIFQQHIVAKSCGRFQCFYSINDLERLSLLVDGIFVIDWVSPFQLPTFDQSIIFNIPLTARLTCEVIWLTRKFLQSVLVVSQWGFTSWGFTSLATPNNDISGLRIHLVWIQQFLLLISQRKRWKLWQKLVWHELYHVHFKEI